MGLLWSWVRYRKIVTNVSNINCLQIPHIGTSTSTSLTTNCAWSLDNPLLRGLKSGQKCASLGVMIFSRPSALSLLWLLVITYVKYSKLDNKVRKWQRRWRRWRWRRRMSKTRTMIMEGDGYNNKREDCMIRKEDTIYFDELTVLLLLLLWFRIINNYWLYLYLLLVHLHL